MKALTSGPHYGVHRWKPNSTGRKPNLSNEAEWFSTATEALNRYQEYWEPKGVGVEFYVRSGFSKPSRAIPLHRLVEIASMEGDA